MHGFAFNSLVDLSDLNLWRRTQYDCHILVCSRDWFCPSYCCDSGKYFEIFSYKDFGCEKLQFYIIDCLCQSSEMFEMELALLWVLKNSQTFLLKVNAVLLLFHTCDVLIYFNCKTEG